MIGQSLNNESTKKLICPICAEVGKKVELFTVRSLTKEDFIPMIQESDYFFCTNPDCEVIYYSLSQEVIRKHQIKTRVGLKEKESPRPVCYCFGHTIEDIHNEISEKGKTTLEKEIADKIQAGLCHCEDANPEGRCCLGNVALAVRDAFQLYGTAKNEKNNNGEMPHACCTSDTTQVK